MLLDKPLQGTPSLGQERLNVAIACDGARFISPKEWSFAPLGWGEAPCHESSLCKTFYNLFSNFSNFFPFFLANAKKKNYVCAIFKDDRLADTAEIK